MVVQIEAATADLLPLPLLTMYGDGRVIAATDDGWRQGTVDEFQFQDFLEEADNVGLLDETLVLLDADDSDQPDIVVSVDVDGSSRRHQFDLARIEWPIEPRAFLNRAATQNIFGLTEPFVPTAWLNCDEDACASATSPDDPISRPVLPHEDVDTLVSGANALAS